MKTVPFKMPTRPTTADEWVGAARPEPKPPAEPMKRFTIDVPASLHRRVKAGCAVRGVKMADLVRELLEREFAAKS